MIVESRFRRGDYRVRPHRPARTAVVAGILMVALGASGWGLYDLGRHHGGYDAQQARATEAHLRIEIAELRDRVTALSNRNTLLQRADRIDRDALGQLRGVIEERDRRVARLEEELAFYRNLVSPSETEPGLHVRRLSVTLVPGSEDRFRYELVLTQLNGDDTYVGGRVDLTVMGQVDGQQKVVNFKDLAVEEATNTRFRFKYFQTLGGVIRLPAEFRPSRLRLKVVPEGNRVDAIEENYAWNSLISEGA